MALHRSDTIKTYPINEQGLIDRSVNGVSLQIASPERAALELSMKLSTKVIVISHSAA